ncbi:MAG: hydrogenase formation protein HypD [Clostridiales Family XIII bacterium]|jgi:hydrogenase expression/formation protein HypD|nr:hydrogenase formation protein HypD [Clostridiales Family XIII bacterium]
MDRRDLGKKIEYLKRRTGEPLKLMEVCGTHTAGIYKSGIRDILSPTIRLISGPGCPVCVTPASYIDKCAEYALAPAHTIMCFGDMLKVPGKDRSLSEVRAEGGRAEMIYSPFEVLERAMSEPKRMFIVAAVGFETTVPAYALLLEELIERKIENVKLLTALKSAVPAIGRICEEDDIADGFLCPGHVSVVTGSAVYEPLAARYGKPFVVAGFEAEHLTNAIFELARLSEIARDRRRDGNLRNADKAHGGLVLNLYGEAVSARGNVRAQSAMRKYFEADSVEWRGLGALDASGFYLREEYLRFDAGSRDLAPDDSMPDGCRCADVVMGRVNPVDCPLFGVSCAPGDARGPCMVSAEGACGIVYENMSAHGE